MAAVTWTGLDGPGDVRDARVSADISTIAVCTDGGVLYVRRQVPAGWVWERAGIPPSGLPVRDAVLLPDPQPGAVTAAVVADDLQVWLYLSGDAPATWTALDGPSPDPGLPRFAESGAVVASTIPHGTGLQHTLMVSSESGRPWIRQGIDPDGTWFRIAADDDWITSELATVLVSVSPTSAPQAQLFAVVANRQTFEKSIRVAVRENALWTWIDPGGPAINAEKIVKLSATSIRDADGRLQACAIVGLGDPPTVGMLMGSGHTWRWVDLDRPPVPRGLGAAVVASKRPDPAAGDEPVVVARVGHDIWTRTLTGSWTNLGTTPGDVAVVDPTSALELAITAQPTVWSAGVSWARDLWTVQRDTAGVRWEGHGCPGSVAGIVGGYPDTPLDGLTDRPVAVFVLDEYGVLWVNRTWGNPDTGFTAQSGFWTYHGMPTPDTPISRGGGVLTQAGNVPQPEEMPLARSWVFVAGSDGHLWARTARSDGWTWVDHGAPGGRSVRTAAAPLALNPPTGPPTMLVLADDGQVWMRTSSDGEGTWVERGSPPGQQIFVLVGAAALPAGAGRQPVAVVVTGDRRVSVNIPSGTTFPWTDLGTPTSAEKIVAGIGVEVVTGAGGIPALDIVLLGSPSEQLWCLRWSPGAVPQWTPLGRPGGSRIADRAGTRPDPANPGGCLVSVIGSDQEVWVTPSTVQDGAWTRWDPPSDQTTALAASATSLLGTVPCVVVVDDRRRVQLVTPQLD
jgi:hypothetical protein